MVVKFSVEWISVCSIVEISGLRIIGVWAEICSMGFVHQASMSSRVHVRMSPLAHTRGLL